MLLTQTLQLCQTLGLCLTPFSSKEVYLCIYRTEISLRFIINELYFLLTSVFKLKILKKICFLSHFKISVWQWSSLISHT